MTSNLKSESDHNQNYGTIEDDQKNEAQKAKGNHFFFNNKTEKYFSPIGWAKNYISLNWNHTVILLIKDMVLPLTKSNLVVLVKEKYIL